MMRDIADIISKYPNCKQVKVENQKPGGITQEIDIPTWKWYVIKMYFITGCYPNSILVIVDRMTKSSNFFDIKTTNSAEKYNKI